MVTRCDVYALRSTDSTAPDTSPRCSAWKRRLNRPSVARLESADFVPQALSILEAARWLPG